ncbi:hypothetical protein [Saccharopolyspora spinosa]|uniref:Uncharacterized protein n=1 Tax=Saccharopolyspora spinosa TaxID=60894 RepID=A0A2N3Y8I4_SACSN|nr:hypothetical protein [Saccharopolyspora spinosa]PKW19237.1 hypothetical protein A8926_7400 [Saccharopolyspora spinosa]
MSASSVASVLTVVPVAIWYICHYWAYRPQHAGGGEGALTVRYLTMRVEAETSSGGRHRLREPLRPRGEMADDFADAKTRVLPMIERELPVDHEDFAPHPVTLRRILAGPLRM